MISQLEKEITFRYLKTRKKNGFINVISIFSFIGISLGVAVLIVVMSVMNGFRSELIDKIVGFNAHVVVSSYSANYNDNEIPFWAKDWADLYINGNPVDRAILEMSHQIKISQSFKNQNKTLFDEQCLTIPFEKFVIIDSYATLAPLRKSVFAASSNVSEFKVTSFFASGTS